MKKNFQYLVFIAFLLNAVNCFGQYQHIQWQKSLGGSYQEIARLAQRSIQTSDGGYIICGGSNSVDGNVTGNHGNTDFWVVKLNSNRNIIWQKSLGGSGNDLAFCIQQTTDGGYIVSGYSGSNNGDVSGNHGGADYWIVKLTSSGNITWQKSLGGTDSDVASSIQQTNDGGYIIAGHSDSNDGDVSSNHGDNDFWIVKLDSNGNITWQKTLGGTLQENCYSIQQTIDGGYIVAGQTLSNDGDVINNNGIYGYWIVKLNSNGNIIWQKAFGGSAAVNIQQTNDGGYIAVGSANANGGNVTGNHGGADYWIVKLNSTGNITWQKSLGGSSSDYAYSAQQTSDGGYIVVGYSISNDGDVTGNHGSSDIWLVKLNSSGNISWQKSLGGSWGEYGSSVQQIPSGYIVIGESSSRDWDVGGNHGNSDIWILKIADGNCVNSVVPSGPLTFCSGGGVVLTANSGTNYLWNTGATTQSIFVDASGTYTAYVDGCQYGQAVNVYERTNPLAPISAIGATTFCSGDSVILFTNSPTGQTFQWLKGGISLNGDTLSYITVKIGGTYKVIVTDMYGCSKTSAGISVTVKPKPAATITASGPIAFCAGGSVTFTTSTGTGYTYQWKKNNVNISGATNISYTASIAGTYKVLVTSSNGCTKISPTKTVTIPCRDENSFEEISSITAFPIPVRDVLNLEIKDFSGNGWIYVMNVLGETIVAEEINFDKESFKSIDMNRFSSGSYMVIVRDGRKKEIVKVIKE